MNPPPAPHRKRALSAVKPNDRSYLTEVKTYIRNVEEPAIVYEATVNQYVE